MAELHNFKELVLITEYRKTSAYLVNVNDYESMQNRLFILNGIVHGELELSEGKVVSHGQAKDNLSKWLE